MTLSLNKSSELYQSPWAMFTKVITIGSDGSRVGDTRRSDTKMLVAMLCRRRSGGRCTDAYKEYHGMGRNQGFVVGNFSASGP